MLRTEWPQMQASKEAWLLATGCRNDGVSQARESVGSRLKRNAPAIAALVVGGLDGK